MGRIGCFCRHSFELTLGALDGSAQCGQVLGLTTRQARGSNMDGALGHGRLNPKVVGGIGLGAFDAVGPSGCYGGYNG
jgi:hypothetical protein